MLSLRDFFVALDQLNMSLRCAHCSELLAVAEGGRLPPWCPRCGNDLRAGDLLPEVADAQLDRWEAQVTSGDFSTARLSTEGSLLEGIQRVRQSQEGRHQEYCQIRRAGLGAFLGGLAFVAVGGFVIWFNAWWEGKAVVPVRLVLLLLLPLGISLAGLYSFLTGEKTLAIEDDVLDPVKSNAEQ